MQGSAYLVTPAPPPQALRNRAESTSLAVISQCPHEWRKRKPLKYREL